MSGLFLYAHGGSCNHGCEAIVRGTHELLSQHFVLFSQNPEEDKQYRLDNICDVRSEGQRFTVYSSEHIMLKLKSKLDKNAYHKFACSELLKQRSSILLAVGGDVYCYQDNYRRMGFLNRELKKNGNKTVLFGCSIEPDIIKMQDVQSDLNLYDRIIARESITYETLLNQRIKNAVLLPDPAFYMNPRKIDISIPDKKLVGINVSPLVSKKNSFVIENCWKLINYIVNNTDYSILLIPHVIWTHDSDFNILRLIKEKIPPDRVILIEDDLDAEQIKYCISLCSYVVTARTHVSIAAYSQNIPTLVLGYSVKAKGLARDIYGDEEGHVIDSNRLNNDMVLTKMFEKMEENPCMEKLKAYNRMVQSKVAQFEELISKI